MGKKQTDAESFLEGASDGIEISQVMDEVEASINTPETPPGTPPPETPPETPPGTPPPGTPPPETPPGTPPLEKGGTKPPPSVPADVQNTLLNEIFGGAYANIEDLKKEDIPGKLKEAETLRQQVQTLQDQLKNPAVGFANESVGLFNEFVKSTGISNYNVFDKLMNVDLNTLNPVDGLVLNHVMTHPRFSGKEDLVRKTFEKKYQTDPDSGLSEDEIKMNQITLEGDGENAINELKKIKEGIKLPEKPNVLGQPETLTPEKIQGFKDAWSTPFTELDKTWKAIPLFLKGTKEPFMQYAIPDEVRKDVINKTLEMASKDGLEVNPDNMKDLYGIMLREVIVNRLPDILHAVAEKARSSTQEIADEMHDHPSARLNPDGTPPDASGTPPEDPSDAAYEAEKKNLT